MRKNHSNFFPYVSKKILYQVELRNGFKFAKFFVKLEFQGIFLSRLWCNTFRISNARASLAILPDTRERTLFLSFIITSNYR